MGGPKKVYSRRARPLIIPRALRGRFGSRPDRTRKRCAAVSPAIRGREPRHRLQRTRADPFPRSRYARGFFCLHDGHFGDNSISCNIGCLRRWWQGGISAAQVDVGRSATCTGPIVGRGAVMVQVSWKTIFVLWCLAGAPFLICATILSAVLLLAPAGVTAAAPAEHAGRTSLPAVPMSVLAFLAVMVFAADGSGRRTGQGIRDLATFPTENPDPIMRVARGGKVLYANPAGLALLHELGGDVGQPAPERWRQALERVLASGGREAFEEQYDGRAFSVWAVPVAEKEYVNLYAHDVTARKHAEADASPSGRGVA